MNGDIYLTVREASQYADVSEHTVRRILRLIRSDPEKVYSQIPIHKRTLIASSPYQLEGKALKINRLGKHTNSPLVYRVSRDFLSGFFNINDDSIVMVNQDGQERTNEQGEEIMPTYEASATMKMPGRDGLETVVVEGPRKRGRKKTTHHSATPLIDDDSLIGLITDMKRQVHAQEYQIRQLTQQNKDLVAIVKRLLEEKGIS